MLTFITSLRHPDIATDYAEIERLLSVTLRSVDHQTSRSCAVVVVGNKTFVPPADIDIPVTVREVDFPPPDFAHERGPAHLESLRRDKGAKLAVALAEVREGHVMIMDADDFVNHDLASYADMHREAIGWYVDRGIRYDVANGLWRTQRRFNEVCGTSLIVRRDALPTVSLPAGVTQAEVVDAYGADCVDNLLGSHWHLRTRFDLPPLPFAGAAYAVNNGHNDSAQPPLAFGKPVSKRLATQFGLPSHRRSAMWSRAVRGLPIALTHYARRSLGALLCRAGLRAQARSQAT